MSLEAASRVAAALAVLACGALLRAGGIIGEAEVQAGSTLATYLTLPCLALRVFSGTTGTGDVSLSLLAAVASTALLSALFTSALGALVVFSGRRRPERALLTAAAVGSGGGLFTSARAALSPAGSYGHALAFAFAAGGDAALPLALAWCQADAFASLLSSRVLLGSWGGRAFPESYEHADGGLYSGEWGAPGRGRGGVGRGSAASSTPSSAAAAGAAPTTTSDAPASASKQGLGVYRYTSGARYEGQWHAGQKSGRGVYVFPKGGRYEGEWRDGVPDGIGVKVLSKKKSASSSSVSSLRAGFWRGGSFEGPLPLWQCADAAAGARAAARAARKLSLGGGGVAAALESFLTQPLLWAVVLGSLVRVFAAREGAGLLASFGLSTAAAASSSSSSFSSSLLDVATKAAANAHLPLALLLSGAAAFSASKAPDGSSLLRDAFNNADAAASLGLRASSAAAAAGVFAFAASALLSTTTTTAAAATLAASTVLACSLSPCPVDLPRLALRFRVNDAAASAVAGWSAVSAPVLAAGVVAALPQLVGRPTGGNPTGVAAVAAAVSVASVAVSLIAREASLSSGRKAAFAAREAARAGAEAEEAGAAAAAAAARAAATSPSAAARAAARARAAAVAPKPGVGFAAVDKKGDEEKRKGSSFRDVEGGSEEGRGEEEKEEGRGGTAKPSALPSSSRPRQQTLLPPTPPRRRIIAPPLRRALRSPAPPRLAM